MKKQFLLVTFFSFFIASGLLNAQDNKKLLSKKWKADAQKTYDAQIEQLKKKPGSEKELKEMEGAKEMALGLFSSMYLSFDAKETYEMGFRGFGDQEVGTWKLEKDNKTIVLIGATTSEFRIVELKEKTAILEIEADKGLLFLIAE